jgi:hypothetical protein
MLKPAQVKKRFVLIVFALFAIYILFAIHGQWKEQRFREVRRNGPSDDVVNSVRSTINVIEAPPPVTLFMRMTGMHVKRFYCDFLRTAVLFWPASYGKLVLVFDQESSLDHKLANILERQFHQFFPDRKLEILYEPLPMNYETLLKLPWPKRDTGYNRQIWSSFFNDLYTNDAVIAWVDSDTAISTSVTLNFMYYGTRLRVIGTDCTLLHLHIMLDVA